ncbi:hypothetical protein ACA910_017192 [Epithemia clementina (nom. ined.)]
MSMENPTSSPAIAIAVEVADSLGWTCSACTYRNKPEYLCCDVCGTSKVNDSGTLLAERLSRDTPSARLIKQHMEEIMKQQQELMAEFESNNQQGVPRTDSMRRLKKTQESIRELSNLLSQHNNTENIKKKRLFGRANRSSTSGKQTESSNTHSHDDDAAPTKTAITTVRPLAIIKASKKSASEPDVHNTGDVNPWAAEMDHILDRQQQLWNRVGNQE